MRTAGAPALRRRQAVDRCLQAVALGDLRRSAAAQRVRLVVDDAPALSLLGTGGP